MENKIHTSLKNILAERLKEVTLSPKFITTIEKEILKKYEQNPEKEFEKIIKETLRYHLFLAIKKDKTKVLFKKLIKPYLFLYQQVNEVYNLEDNEKNRDLFIDINVFLRLNLAPEIDLSIPLRDMYRDNIPKKIMQKKETLIEKEFEGDKKILKIIISTLTEKERNTLYSFKSDTKLDLNNYYIYRELVKKVKAKMQCYFLMKINGMKEDQIIKELQQVSVSKIPDYLQKLEDQFYTTFHVQKEVFEEYLEKLQKQNPDEYQIVLIFLGRKIYWTHVSEEQIFEIIKNIIKNLKAENVIEKKTYRSKILEEFKGDPIVLNTIMATLTQEELEILGSDIEESEKENFLLTEIIKKLKQNMCCYFLLKKKGLNNLEIIDEIKRNTMNQSIFKYLKILQNQFYEENHITEEDCRDYLENLKETSANYLIWRIFLGKSYYWTNISENKILEVVTSQIKDINLFMVKEDKSFKFVIAEYLKETNLEYYNIFIKKFGIALNENNELTPEENEIFQKIIKKIKLMTNHKTLFTKFPRVPKEEIIEIVEELKISHLHYYQIIIKKHGNSFNEWNTLTPEENGVYQNAIKKIKMKYTSKKKMGLEEILGILSKSKKNYQQILLQNKKMLELLKLRKDELYSKETLYTKELLEQAFEIYATNIVQFGNLNNETIKKLISMNEEWFQGLKNKEALPSFFQIFFEDLICLWMNQITEAKDSNNLETEQKLRRILDIFQSEDDLN